ncbi:MAG: hypothetical protein ACJ76H_16525 [Bacteriovoracaceae bacterium]
MYVLFLSFLLVNFSHAITSIGTTSGCPEKAELVAHEGDSFVTIKLNGKKWKLISTEGKRFSRQAKEPVTFRTQDNDPTKGEPTLEFEMTSMVMSSLPRLVVSYSGVQNKCRVELHESRDKN